MLMFGNILRYTVRLLIVLSQCTRVLDPQTTSRFNLESQQSQNVNLPLYHPTSQPEVSATEPAQEALTQPKLILSQKLSRTLSEREKHILRSECFAQITRMKLNLPFWSALNEIVISLCDYHEIPGAGQFDSTKEMINIAVYPWGKTVADWLKASTLVGTLKNELHHAAIYSRNRKTGCLAQGLLASEPYCKKNHINQQLAKNFNTVMDEALLTMNRLFENYCSYLSGKMLSAERKSFHETIKKISSMYPNTLVYTASIPSMHQFFMNFILPGTRSNSPNFPYRVFPQGAMPHITDNRIKIRLSQHVSEPVQEGKSNLLFQYRLGSPKRTPQNRFDGFLLRMILAVHSLRSGHLHHYSTELDKLQRMSELASFVDELPGPLKKYIFPGFCGFFTNFFNQSHCEDLEPPRMQI